MRQLKQHQFPSAVLLLYALASGLLLWHHEPWRDEMQCWEIARQSATLSEMFFNARYEGHPSAWYLVLFAITRFTRDFGAVQVFHWLLMLASVALVLWRSPFGRWQKLLLVFGYFFLFEYGVLTRIYAIGILLAFGICSLVQDWRRHWLAIHLLLFCLMQCSLFAALLGLAFYVPLFFTQIKSIRESSFDWQKLALGAAICTAGLLLSAADMAPPADTNYAADWKWANPDWKPALGAFFRAMAPMPPLDMHGWNLHIFSQWFDWELVVLLECSLAIVLLGCCIWALRKSPFALCFFVLAWLAISVFLAVKMQGFVRHHGHFYLAWVMAFWLKKAAAPTKVVSPLQKMSPLKLDSFPVAFFSLILVLQVAAALPLAYFDLKYPFSQSRKVADYLKANHLESRFIVGKPDYSASPVAFHLDRPIYYPNTGKLGSYLLWNREREARAITDIVPVALELCHQQGQPILLLLSAAIPAEQMVPSVRLLQSFTQVMELSEEYYLYEVGCGE